MSDALTLDESKRARPVGLVVSLACLLLALACLGTNVFSWGRRLGVRPVVLHVGSVALSAEITDNPSCAPLTKSCWVLPPANRAKYLSVWLYTMTTHGAGAKVSDWHVIALRLSRGGPPSEAGSPECFPSC